MKSPAALVTAATAVLTLSSCAAPPASSPPAPSQTTTVPSSPTATPARSEPTSTTTGDASSQPVSPTPDQPVELTIDSVWNFRDVAGAGAGLDLVDGGHMARGVVFRSGKLKGLSAADERRLIAAGVTDIFDLRTDEVAERTPDPAIGDATYRLINVYAVYSYSDPPATDAAEAMVQREQLNRDFVADPEQRERIGGLLEDIADAKGAVVIHCSEGKDRTGWVSAVLQLIAGVDETTIMDEYLLSNERRAELVAKDVAKVRTSKGKNAAEIRRVRLEVRERYLLAGLDELTTRYGDLKGYLTDGLGLSQSTISRLHDKLVLR